MGRGSSEGSPGQLSKSVSLAVKKHGLSVSTAGGGGGNI